MRKLLLATTLIAGLATGLVAPVVAQTLPAAALLVADTVEVAPGAEILTAKGNVEVFYNGVQMRAASITYDRAKDVIAVTGPVTLVEADGTVLFAEYAELSPDLRAGLLRGARLVLEQELQIAATEITRSPDGRYTQMYQTVASSCTVCEANPVPVWQIRAKRVVHDTEERQLYFEDAQVRVMGVPLAYAPRLRLPDPTVERATGLLSPEVISDDQLGLGIKLPYFVAIDPYRDVLITPYFATRGTRSLALRYRQAFQRGDISISGAISDDELTTLAWRGYLLADASFDVGRDFKLTANAETVSDNDYLRTYGISDIDRLSSRLAFTRTKRDEFTEVELIHFRSLRAADDNRFLPTVMASAGTTQRFVPGYIGGIATTKVETNGYFRTGDDPSSGLSRDVSRFTAQANWRRDWVWSTGIVTAIEGQVAFDHYDINQDPTYSTDTITRVTPYLGLEARYPMARAGSGGVTHVLEPVVQLVFARQSQHGVPNEDSTTVAFDEGNLFSFSRFAGQDAQEMGDRLNIGLTYTRLDPSGWQAGLTVGRVVRSQSHNQFNPGSGLDGDSSDWLASLRIAHNETFSLQSRALFDDQLSFARSETLLSYATDSLDLETGFTWLQADPAAGRPIDTSEWSLDAQMELGGDWTARVDGRYDFVTNDASRAGLGLSYWSDCIRVDFDVERRFTSTATLAPATTFGLTVALAGIGADNKGRRGKSVACGY